MAVKRLYVEKKPGLFDVQAKQLKADLQELFHLKDLRDLRLFRRYDIEGLTQAEYDLVKPLVFFEPPLDIAYEEALPEMADATVFAVEALPGQFDMTADSAAQCVQLITQRERPLIKTALIISLIGKIEPKDLTAIKDYCINKVEAREDLSAKPSSLAMDFQEPPEVEVLNGFIDFNDAKLAELRKALGLAMSLEDLVFCQRYFNAEKRNPTITEIRVIDTYWSDHCRHTTFTTAIDDVKVDTGKYNNAILNSYERYLSDRDCLGRNHKPITLMDIATMGMRKLRAEGKLDDLDVSEEINACSVKVNIDVDGTIQPWLVMFKNETHNHPTEIEPFGGAATCLGGAIRDPLSGRSYVYQAMRITGSGDPRQSIADTLPGKLPQRKITKGAAKGYSSYGNQIGLATGEVREIFHPGYIAKHMEIGAVVGAAPQANVQRLVPAAGDLVVLVGGATGRDGIGGATGSSKEHDMSSLTSCGAEVQKGNAPTERKLQRLFRNPKISPLIKRCNDFGAGGVAVAIGELTDGLIINLDAVPKKYAGLDGTELAISESQERMAVVLAPEDIETFKKAAAEENLEATVVAEVTQDPRLIMQWRNKNIVDLKRSFLQTNGVRQHIKAFIQQPDSTSYFTEVAHKYSQYSDPLQGWLDNLRDLNVCSQKGLSENFDSTIGANTVLMPFGGKEQLTPPAAMVAKIPVLDGNTKDATAMSYGFNPYLMSWSPFHGSIYSIVEAVSKIAAVGGDIRKIRLTLQEYFQSLGQDEKIWGKPLAALLGALWIQEELSIPAIGGKDSMSGTFMDLHVPPTLVAFALAMVNSEKVLSPEFKHPENAVIYLPLYRDEQDLPKIAQLLQNCTKVYELANIGSLAAVQPIGFGGISAALTKMALGNNIGFKFTQECPLEDLMVPYYGALLVEVKDHHSEKALLDIGGILLGHTTAKTSIVSPSYEIPLETLKAAYTEPLAKIYPTSVPNEGKIGKMVLYDQKAPVVATKKFAKPRVFIPVFPGTNCEYDSAKAFTKAGAVAETFVIKNLTPQAIEESVKHMVKSIESSQIIMLPGGFSGGDEPDGSGKFIAAMFRNPEITEAVRQLLQKRDGLMLGICNGFQALIKLGLLPYGDIRQLSPDDPTLTYNTIGRHISCMAETKIVSKLSPWFSQAELGSVHSIPLSHGEGRFCADKKLLEQLSANGQIATQYVNHKGELATAAPDNPNGSDWAIEGITSPDGRILGKMGHSERVGDCIGKNVPGDKEQFIFQSGVAYFK